MTFKHLYFCLVGLLTGLVVSVYFSSEKLDQESFGNPSFDKQVAISTPTGTLNGVSYTLKYSPSIQRRLSLPMLLSVVVGIAIVLGITASRGESKKKLPELTAPSDPSSS